MRNTDLIDGKHSISKSNCPNPNSQEPTTQKFHKPALACIAFNPNARENTQQKITQQIARQMTRQITRQIARQIARQITRQITRQIA